MFKHVWFNTCKALTIDAEAERKELQKLPTT